ncbi:MAG: choice-of-anchor tandem repeat GloVer-containing protein [Candidatus Sulfotelmatobacter sp.]
MTSSRSFKIRTIRLVLLSALLLIAAHPAQGQTETVLYNLFTNDPDGAYPYAGLTSDGAGNFYGTTASGGCNLPTCQPPLPAGGTVFELSPNGYGGWNETTIYTFCSEPNCVDGAGPMSNVIFDSAGNLYGTTVFGGSGGGDNGCAAFGNGCGVVYELSPVGTGWKETVLHSFCTQSGCPDGANPGSLIFDGAGNLYGAAGNVFELSPSGGGWTEQVIYGGGGGWLTMDAAGNIFSTTYTTVYELYELSPNGKGGWTQTVIHAFGGGVQPEGIPVLDSVGNLYGTTSNGGYGFGTVYKLSPGNNGQWTETILHSFGNNISDGYLPLAGLVFDAAGNIYGTTAYGGSHGWGTVFELTHAGSGKYKILWNFNGWDGIGPVDSLILDSAGNLYGTTNEGGSTYGLGPDGNGFGVAFELITSTKSGTFTKLASTLNPSIYGQPVTWTAKVITTGSVPPTGKVNFTWGGQSIGTAALDSSGVATLTRSNLNADSYPLTAVYLGDANNTGSASAILSQVVTETTSSATLSSSLNPSTAGQAVTFTATISSPTVRATGPVTFTAGKTVLGTAQLSGGKAKFK